MSGRDTTVESVLSRERRWSIRTEPRVPNTGKFLGSVIKPRPFLHDRGFVLLFCKFIFIYKLIHRRFTLHYSYELSSEYTKVFLYYTKLSTLFSYNIILRFNVNIFNMSFLHIQDTLHLYNITQTILHPTPDPGRYQNFTGRVSTVLSQPVTSGSEPELR